jgi:hypothetical protein
MVMNLKKIAATSLAINLLCLSPLTFAGNQDSMGKTRLTFTFVVPAKSVELADKVFACHATWMAKTHHHSGPMALLSYDVSKMSELTDPVDLKSKPTGKTIYVLNEVYQTAAGVEDHFANTPKWECYDQFVVLVNASKVTKVASASIFKSLTWGGK